MRVLAVTQLPTKNNAFRNATDTCKPMSTQLIIGTLRATKSRFTSNRHRYAQRLTLQLKFCFGHRTLAPQIRSLNNKQRTRTNNPKNWACFQSFKLWIFDRHLSTSLYTRDSKVQFILTQRLPTNTSVQKVNLWFPYKPSFHVCLPRYKTIASVHTRFHSTLI